MIDHYFLFALPPLRELSWLDFFPRPLPLFLPPLCCLLTVAYAELLGDEEGVCLLKATLSEEKATDEKLTDLARSINVDAEVCRYGPSIR